MPATATLRTPEQRRSVRHAIDFPVIAERPRIGDLPLRILNISPDGFMAGGAIGMGRGERLVMRLPGVGRIEAHLVWGDDERAGFRFERLIRPDALTTLLCEVEARQRRAND